MRRRIVARAVMGEAVTAAEEGVAFTDIDYFDVSF